jgi:hypothetical protein
VNASYRFDGNDELCLRFGPDDAPRLLILPPLFDEANRVRHLMVEFGRLLYPTCPAATKAWFRSTPPASVCGRRR